LWLCGLVGICYLFGFIWGLPIFMALYGIACSKRFFSMVPRWLLFVVISAATMWFVGYEMTNLMHLAYTPVINL
jgi:hypothetical protein